MPSRACGEACAEYRTPVDYGLVRFGLDKVAALICGRLPDAHLLRRLSQQRLRYPRDSRPTFMRVC